MKPLNSTKLCWVHSIAALFILLAGTGCAVLTPAYLTVEGHRIYDIQTNPSCAITKQISANIQEAIQQRVNDVTLNNTIPPATLLENPGRNVLTEPFKNATGLFAMASTKSTVKIPH